MSKKGRFYRVHFKTGAVIDLVPKGSVAMGEALIGPGKTVRKEFSGPRWKKVTPPLDVLWKKFRTRRR